MPFENLMRTTEYLDRLDPLRPSLRRTAQVRFDRGQFAEFLEDLEIQPQWRLSPTAMFLAAKAHVQLDQLEDAGRRCERAWQLWREIFDEEGDAPPEQPDQDRLTLSFDVLRAQIRRRSGELDLAEAALARAEDLIEERGSSDPAGFEDVSACVTAERGVLDEAKASHNSTPEPAAEAPVARAPAEVELRPAPPPRRKENNHSVTGAM